MTLALIIAILAVAACGVWAGWEHASRGHWKTSAKTYERRCAVDEALLEQLRGPRRTADQVRGEGR